MEYMGALLLACCMTASHAGRRFVGCGFRWCNASGTSSCRQQGEQQQAELRAWTVQVQGQGAKGGAGTHSCMCVTACGYLHRHTQAGLLMLQLAGGGRCVASPVEGRRCRTAPECGHRHGRGPGKSCGAASTPRSSPRGHAHSCCRRSPRKAGPPRTGAGHPAQ
jgi:hypothetical protein